MLSWQQKKNINKSKGLDTVTMQDRASSCVNDSGTCQQSGTPLTQPRSGPVRYELIDKDGNVVGWASSLPGIEAMARLKFPGQEQDEDRTGKGWDLQVVGS